MVKKKQPDFQKTKLKPGRSLPKGRNVTDTAFKSKKIIISKKSAKGKCDLTIQECLQKALNAASVQSKREFLRQLRNLISEQKETFVVDIPEILSGLRYFLLESEESLNEEAVQIFKVILSQTDDMKLSNHIPYIMNLISCTMTHFDPKIKGVSLRLLEHLSQSHPNLLCQSLSFLQNLQSLLAGPSYNTKSRKNQNLLLLSGAGNKLYSQDWRFQVLAYVSLFLKNLLKSIKGVDDNEAYYDKDDSKITVKWESGDLHLVLYYGGGLEPMDIEKFEASKFKSDEYDLEDPRKVHEFVQGFMDVLSQIYIEEISDGTCKADDDLLMPETLKNLNILFQILIYLGEWVTIVYNSDGDFKTDMKKSFAKDLSDKIFKNIHKFPFFLRGTLFENKIPSKVKSRPCVQLNLAVCYLYCAYIVKPEVPDSFRSHLINYLPAVRNLTTDVKYNSLPMILKLVKAYAALKEFPEVFNNDELQALLSELIELIKPDMNGDNCKKIIQYFLDLSLEPGPHFHDCSGKSYLKPWYMKLLLLLDRMATNKTPVNEKFLKKIRQTACFGHKIFIECVTLKVKVPALRAILQHEDDYLSDTGVSLIYNLPKISVELLEGLSDIMLGTYKQERTITLIRRLTSKIAIRGVSVEVVVKFTILLLNLALDAVNIDKWLAIPDDLPGFKTAWEPCENAVPFSIIPSLQWKNHSKLFKVCCECLKQLPSIAVDKLAEKIIPEIMQDRKCVPIHTVIAMLKLYNPKIQERSYCCVMEDLTITSLFSFSVITTLKMNDEWEKWNTDPLLESLSLDNTKAACFMKHLERETDFLREGILVYYILRVIKLFFVKNLIPMDEREQYLDMLEDLKNNCLESSIDRQPLYVKIYNLLDSYYS